jgi:predicted signal transduction protein with EAL and GGDEF domain
MLLEAVAERLKNAIRDADVISRFGGDEFVILLENVDSITSVARLADRILELIASPMSLAGHELSTSVSIGASMFPKDGSTTSALLKHADLAMYQAKKQSRNAFRFFDQQMNVRTQERLMLENDLRRAVAQKCLTVHYQPQLDVVNRKLVGVEALVRWQHYARGMIPPAEFIPLAEEIGLIDQIGEQVLLKACEQQKAWQHAGFPGVKITVNLSVHQLNESFIECAKRVLGSTSIDPAHVEFEITESALMENISAYESILMQIQALGVCLAIDDFGTGYSSLSYLKRLPIDTLKIDRSFITDLTVNADDAAIGSATIGLAQAMGLKIVAEGVETEAQMQALIQKGCGVMQGYLFSRPLSAAQLTEFLAAY